MACICACVVQVSAALATVAAWQVLALGTSSGTVHLLDYEGNEVGTRASSCPPGGTQCSLTSTHLLCRREVANATADAVNSGHLPVCRCDRLQRTRRRSTACHLTTQQTTWPPALTMAQSWCEAMI